MLPATEKQTTPESSDKQSHSSATVHTGHLTYLSGQLPRRSASLEINHSQHPSQHEITVDEDTGYFIHTPKSDWYGSMSPVYYFAYSAYYIDRSYYMNNSVVIVGQISKKLMILYCGLTINKKEYVFKGHLHKMNPWVCFYGTCTSALWCPVPESITQLPTNIHVKLNKTGDPIAIVPIEIPEKQPARKNDKHRLLVCLKPIFIPETIKYEDIDYRFFIEWVELNRILGVDHISVYILTTSKKMEKVLTYYANTGFLDLRSKQQEPGIEGLVRPRDHFGITDCLYRNFHAYDYLLMIDSDEFIIPQMEQDLDKMIKNLQLTHAKEFGELSFKNTVYFTDLPNNMGNKSDLITINALNHVKPELYYRKKYLVSPKHCLLANTHLCSGRVPNGVGQLNVETSVGRSQHYKHCSSVRQTFYTCNVTNEVYYHDPGLLRFESQLEMAVSKVANEINLK